MSDDDGKSPEAWIEYSRGLKVIDFEKERKSIAKKMGVRASVLDEIIKAERAKDEGTEGQGRTFEIEELEPWPEEVNGAALVSETVLTIQRYLVLPEGSAEIVAFWALHTHCYASFGVTPRLAITSPEKGCGKTTLFDVLACLVAKPLPSANATVATIFRIIDLACPTLLIDEADTFLQENDELRGILNSGHRRGGNILRCVGDDHEPRTFSTWAPVAIAAIGRLPETLDDRSLTCRMRRRKPSEKVQNFRIDRTDDLKVLARKMATWAADHEVTLRAADPDMGALENRTADNWRPLFAIADIAGGVWPKRVRAVAAAALAKQDEQSAKVQLLIDIKDAFESTGKDRISSEDLVAYLIGLEGHPWVEWRRGKPITKSGLARLLGALEIYSDSVRIGMSTPKGYYLGQFTDAFERYICAETQKTPSQTATTQQAYSHSDNLHFQNATDDPTVAFSKPQQAYSHNGCCGVALPNPLWARKGKKEVLSPSLGPEGDDLHDFDA